jgi:ABC-type transport system substrate-binding protein
MAIGLLLAPVTRAAEPQAGGTVSISIESDLATLDPIGSLGSFNDREAGILVYDTLLEMDPKGKIVPNLAEKFEAAPDATWFKVTLHSGVKFHDGTNLDANAVVAHFKRLMDPKQRCRCLADLAPVESIEATGPLEVTFKMKTPAAHFPAVLTDTSGMIVSMAAVEKYGDKYSSNPVGTGPFMFKEWQRGNQIVYVRNPNYWKKPAYLDSVVLRPMPDQQTRYASLKAGNLDILINPDPRDVVDARDGKKLQVFNPGSLATNFVQINNEAADVSDVRVRQALAYALNRDALNKALNKGIYKVANTVFGSGLPGHELVEGYPQYDPAKAKKLIAEYGKPLKLKMSVNASPSSLLTAQALQQMWKKVGIDVEINQMEQVQLIRASNTHDFQLMLYRWAGRADPDMNVYQFFHSKSSTNRVNYKNPEMDKLLEAGRRTIDPKARLDIYHQVNNILARDVPYLLLTYFDNYSLVSPKVHGITLIPDGLIRMNTVWKDK